VTEIRPPTSVRIGDTPEGRGVIAAADIAKGETIEVCPVLELAPGDASGVLGDYVVSLGEGAALMFGYGSLYNHSEDPNAEYIHEADDAYSFNAIRDIAAGEQITISYGDDWWASRDKGP
jgi:SET domain-containing protein